MHVFTTLPQVVFTSRQLRINFINGNNLPIMS